MSHNHILGAWADYDGNVHYEYKDTYELFPVDIFEFCPVCGVKLNNETSERDQQTSL
jgi:hypothetical protein